MYFPVVSPADLELARYHHLHSPDPLIRQRMHYLCLRTQGYGPGECAKILHIHRNTATRWSQLYGVYATKQNFCDAIDWFIEEVNNREYQHELRTLLAPNFQVLKVEPNFS